MKSTNVYVDGFNLYYGCLKGTPFKWLDLSKLCGILLKGNAVNRIRCFTARVRPRPGDPNQQQRQQVYIRALETIPNLSVHYGHFLAHPVRMPLANPRPSGPKTVEAIKTEEKGSDVNLATYLLYDGFRGDYEVAVVVSNDSDLLEPIRIVRRELGLTVGILNPQKRPSRVLAQEADFLKQIRAGALKASQFPTTLKDAHGIITKPKEW
ncbi:6-hydroxy-3-succinoylpyridine 3-monooxygenase HspA [Rubrobacter xylanophilus DSM 9941]|uniref:NYN domain-containing protein n=1 Tax=Rubrobacter xylanophilus TaxID=49319 RepID=UPI001C640F15|nr:NYN domain-containing protein [Rubrobacter xylanophilus]QYJ15191.1 6-hydroxy-3-succinoylpyridine 3-monooxygenase HspA [Rubrobacter xylanophilus DSM 9941]